MVAGVVVLDDEDGMKLRIERGMGLITIGFGGSVGVCVAIGRVWARNSKLGFEKVRD